MATLSRTTAQLTNFLAICRKGKACQRLVFARNAHFTYVPDTPLKEYGITLCFACILTRSLIQTICIQFLQWCSFLASI